MSKLAKSSANLNLVAACSDSIGIPRWAWEDPEWVKAVALAVEFMPEPLELQHRTITTVLYTMWKGLRDITLEHVNYQRVMAERERRKATGHWPGRKAKSQ